MTAYSAPVSDVPTANAGSVDDRHRLAQAVIEDRASIAEIRLANMPEPAKGG